VDRIRQAWDNESSVQLPNYPAGSSGPQESFDLLAQDGRCWVQK